MRFVIAALCLVLHSHGLQLQPNNSLGMACQLGCSNCGYNWYYQNWKSGSPTTWYNNYCGCCGGTQSQQDVCKTVCREPACYSYVGKGWCHVNGVDANTEDIKSGSLDECKISCDNAASHCTGIEYEDGTCKLVFASGIWTAQGGTDSTQCYERGCTSSPTPSPTPYPTPSPTPSPTLSPTASPTPPTLSPTPSPTASPTPPTLPPTYPTPVPAMHTGDASETRTDFEEIVWSVCRSMPPSTTKDGIFKCASGRCITEAAKCNWVDNCADGSDESYEVCPRPCAIVGCQSDPLLEIKLTHQYEKLSPQDEEDLLSLSNCNTGDSIDGRDQVCYGHVVRDPHTHSQYKCSPETMGVFCKSALFSNTPPTVFLMGGTDERSDCNYDTYEISVQCGI